MEKALLATEQSNPRTANIDKMTTMEMLHAMNEENRRVADAVEDALSQIAPLVDHIAEEMEKGGRIFYIGAGTSGRLGVIDAAECPPTFGVSPDKVVAVMAGGTGAMANASEGCEDDAEAGEHDLMKYSINEHDTVIGISAAGAAAYVIGAMEAAKRVGASTASICCNPDTPMSKIADYPIFANTGAEAITGSTRLKAGTAQKFILNMISTCVMIKLGNVYGNYMINLNPTNIKLRKRAIRTICTLTGCDEKLAEDALDKNGNVCGAIEAIKGESVGGAK